jgi:hypothetical protein
MDTTAAAAPLPETVTTMSESTRSTVKLDMSIAATNPEIDTVKSPSVWQALGNPDGAAGVYSPVLLRGRGVSIGRSLRAVELGRAAEPE